MTTRSRRMPLPFRGQKDAEGRRLCSLCGVPVSGRRKSWCSQACVDRYMLSHQGVARDRVWQRDGGVCALCGRDPSDVHGPFLSVWQAKKAKAWEADHIVPLIEGGEHSMENLRTLCLVCHKAETRALAGRLAERRRAAA